MLKKLGIRTEKTTDCLAHDPREEYIRASITKVTKTSSRPLRKEAVQTLVDEIPHKPKMSFYGDMWSDTSLPTYDLTRRWGVPFENTYQTGKADFFLGLVLFLPADVVTNKKKTLTRKSSTNLNEFFISVNFRLLNRLLLCLTTSCNLLAMLSSLYLRRDNTCFIRSNFPI